MGGNNKLKVHAVHKILLSTLNFMQTIVCGRKKGGNSLGNKATVTSGFQIMLLNQANKI